MASNILSRLLPASSGTRSIYDAIREHDAEDESDNEDHAGIRLDEQNLDERFHDQEIDQLLREAAESQTTAGSAFVGQPSARQPLDPRQISPARSRPRWMQRPSERPPRIEEDDDVPESLLLEDDRDAQHHAMRNPPELPPPIPGPNSPRTKIQWDRSRARHTLYEDSDTRPRSQIPNAGLGAIFANPEEAALWRWANEHNLDNFLQGVYDYYDGKGFWSIQLRRVLGLLTSAFVVVFSTFLLSCVDYKAIPGSKQLSEITVPKCTKKMSGFGNLLIWLFCMAWIYQAFIYVTDVRRLWQLRDFYLYLLGIPDKEVQTISWQDVVGRLMNLRDSNPRTALNNTPAVLKYTRREAGHTVVERMDAHDIANRLMKRDNYLIALFNKDILNIRLPIPYLAKRQWFSKTMEFAIKYCVLDYVFKRKGQVSLLFLKESHRKELVEGLRQRFIFAGFATIFCAPFLVTYFCAVYFLRYFTEFQRNPSELGSRAYTPLAEWKFREFNELWHLFQRRTNMSRPFASRYIEQFPKNKTAQVATFVAFVTGAVAAVLGVASLLDPENFLSFEITKDRTVLFYLSIAGGAWAVARGMVPADDLVYDPEFAIKNVIDYTHYYPAHWKGQLHSDEVRREFSGLYQMKIVIFFEEMLSLLFTPFVLWFSLPDCSERIVDFFREFTIHVDGLGYVCSFAVFEFGKTAGGANQGAKDDQGTDLRDDYYTTKDDKMLTSYYYFMDSYANNPKGGRFHNHTAPRRQFNPPPSFPGLAGAATAGPNASKATLNRATGSMGASTFRSPTVRANAAHASPTPSLLLDPHHQPRPKAARSSGANRRSTGRRFSENDADENLQPRDISSSTILEEDSELGDSWRIGRARDAFGDDEHDDYDDDAADDAGVAGVLGMISKFTQGLGAGANMATMAQ